MSKAQTDIRTTSYDALTANPNGYVGTIDDALTQIREEMKNADYYGRAARPELLQYLGVANTPSAGPSVEMDENPRYGFEPKVEEPSFYSLAYALKHFPGSFLHRSTVDRFKALSDSQLQLFRAYRASALSVEESLARVEAYPYPTPKQGPDLDAMNFDPRN